MSMIQRSPNLIPYITGPLSLSPLTRTF
uniref:Uncharacterized protein n=1 Tax=Arundo donax TaxID=35708 RepID=A0A0A9GMR1_ARUDO